ncbi:MAG: CHAT domain-containing protein, partial [Candidatus Electrothrix sp. LOE2]|nr:CHAT domain-containing protein [Candidatus Electrothrix sp. LOE2]
GKEAAKTHIPQYMKELLLEAESKGETTATPKHTGYLLFEDEQGKKALVEARLLGELFHRQRIGLVVLSACQSAAMDEEDAMSSVAAWLTHAGIPGVLAMTHSVLVTTAGLLFARFYHSLFKGDPVGKALDDARAALYFDPKRGERLRGVGGNQSVTLELHDWFLPALYQTGPNRPLLSREDGSEAPEPDQKHNLPKMQESGFFGRTRELWRVERAFTVQGCRRFSVTGFGGQGKTYLALEAGYWLLRTGLFRRVCFVSFAGFQGIDPVGVTISTLATVLDESLPDAEAAEAALKGIPTLLILDNLETLADGDGLHELLSAATRWSEAGDTRVLLTSRQPDFNHPDYPTAGSFRHQCLNLKGLGEQDALDWFGELMRLPPEPKFGMPQRSALVSLFKQVDFHPLSISLLAAQLKERRPAELGERLEALLDEQPADREDRSLLASLELSLERLPKHCREWLPRLGVFVGGCLEEMVGKVTGLAEAEANPDIENPDIAKGRKIWEALQSSDPIAIIRAVGRDIPESELSAKQMRQLRELVNDETVQKLRQWVETAPKTEIIAGADQSTWPQLREALLRAGLMEADRIPATDKTFLRFHPTLAPALWQKLGKEDKVKLLERYWQAYYQLSGALYHLDDRKPHTARALVQCELPNLFRAVHTALQSDSTEEGVWFAEYVNRFLNNFGLWRDYRELTETAAKAGGAVGSYSWFTARFILGQQFEMSGQPREAAAVFQDILTGLKE